MLSFAHIINPFNGGPSSDLTIAQRVTFESMRRAKAACLITRVELLSAQCLEDHPIVPEGFTKTPDLDRSVLDLGEFLVPRKLPLISDILSRLYASSDADYLIYTNVDIALMPNFYESIAGLIGRGFDSLVINRRTIDRQFHDPQDLPLMWATSGDRHPGWDCFVFHRSLYPRLDLQKVVIGADFVGRAMILNLACHGRNFIEVKGAHLTFHIGDDQVWKKPELNDYGQFNLDQTRTVLANSELQFGERLLRVLPPPDRHKYHPYLKRFYAEPETKRPSILRRLFHRILRRLRSNPPNPIRQNLFD